MKNDFYSAYYTLNRGKFVKVEEKYLAKLKRFIEGIVHLMKKKFEKGVVCLSDVESKFKIGDFLKTIIYGYRAYGYFCLGRHEEALLDYRKLEKIVSLT